MLKYFSYIWWFFWSIVGIPSSILLIILGEDNATKIKGGVGLLISIGIFCQTYSSWKHRKDSAQKGETGGPKEEAKPKAKSATPAGKMKIMRFMALIVVGFALLGPAHSLFALFFGITNVGGIKLGYIIQVLGLALIVYGGGKIWRQFKAKKSAPSSGPVQAAVDKVKSVVQAVKVKSIGEKEKSKRNWKKWLIAGGVILALGLIGLIYSLFSAGTFVSGGWEKVTYDFPVWSLRDGEVSVFHQEEYYDKSSARYVVVGNTSDKIQRDIDIYEMIPSGMAEKYSDLRYDLEPEVISAKDPVVLRFNIAELAPQKSAVIRIASAHGYSEIKKRCAAANISDCEGHIKEIADDKLNRAQTDYQAETEPVAKVYDLNGTNLSPAEKQYLAAVVSQSNNLVSQAKTEPFKASGGLVADLSKTVKGWVDKVSGLIEDFSRSGMTAEEKFVEDGDKIEVQSTSLTKDYFPAKINDVWVLTETKDVSSTQAPCRSVSPLKVMLGTYAIPKQYLPTTAYRKTSDLMAIAVYPTVKDARLAGKNCAGGSSHVFFRSGYLEVSNIGDATQVMGGKAVIVLADNYLAYFRVGAGTGWSFFYNNPKNVTSIIREAVYSQY